MSINSLTSSEKIIAHAAAGTALTIAAGHASASLDKFATWFLTAFGASLALILSNINDVSGFISLHTIACVAYLFLWASIFCLVQRYIAMVIGCGASSAKECREIGEKFVHMDVDEFIVQMKAGMPGLLRLFSNSMLDAISKGDFVAGGRLFLRLTLIQGLFASIEVIVLLVALSQIVNEIST
ncbi:hypothetical protein A1359_03995 [Methylomonas lenta]|uniref:Uncharacterized protein n=1 Tax=Methylomonas lenta TaxID=980561 RepID=A0A177NQZ4_9GAMM|nr:hypothetical protein [Methylomonas lenta]OAI19460.1 hypothetical protein A1359_03995 [Methylomonas lenta]